MTRAEALRQKLVGGTPVVPAQIGTLRIAVTHLPGPIERGVPARVGTELSELLAQALPLFAAGFCAAEAAAPGAAAAIAGRVETMERGFVLTLTGAAHGPRLPHVMLRVIEAKSQTPAGAYERLLDLLDGDEEEAKAVFNPLSLAADVAAIEVAADGTGEAVSLQLDRAPAHAGLDPWSATIPRDAERLIFEGASFAKFDDRIDNAVLSLFDTGCFHDFGAVPGQPELFVQGGRFMVEGWDGAPVFLTELLQAVSGGQARSLRVTAEGSTL